MAPFESSTHRRRLFNYREYVGGNYFSEAFGWKGFSGNGHVLMAVHPSPGGSADAVPEASLIVVGEILPSRFWVDKVGGWKKEFGPMKSAKFNLALGEPQDVGFADEPRLPWQRQHQLRNEIGKLTWLHSNQGDRVCEWVRGTSVQ
ncbi:hypothetical protein EV421DRAFT_1898420 [Armillaria borealis]|uniref:Uncharacterized protein n=1 Tax=Armillaria borealis TaxID=47425 RepID=A0AA39JZ67_9AGAR|nr:hypothetical protein EV421DRAFT_1898420 [Armillaria borealis]